MIDVKSLGKRLKSKGEPAVYHIESDGSPTTSLSEWAPVIHWYWDNFWIERVTDAQIRDHLSRDLPPQKFFEQAAPSHELLVTTVRRQRGSAGPDGWSAEEIRHLPEGAVGLFRQPALLP